MESMSKGRWREGEEKTEKGELCIGSLWRNVNMISE